MPGEASKPTVRTPARIGKYEIQGLLGRGGMGAVYQGYQADLDRTVAIKVMIAGEAASEEMIVRFLREARAAAKLVHPYIVQVHDVGTEGALHFIVMEHIDGKTVAGWMELQALTIDQAMRIAYFAARALEFAHDNGVIHRDVKPSNIVIDNSGRIRLLDFGLSKMIASTDAALTQSGTVLGTPAYMPPEAAFGTMDEVDARSDIYSLGAVLYEMLCGRLPFPGENVYSILRKIEEDEPDPPTSLKPGIPYEAEAICLRAMAKKKAERFKTAGEMAAAIQHFLGEEPSQVGAPVPNPAGSRRRMLAAAAFVAPLLLAAGALATFALRPRGDPRPPSPPAVPRDPGPAPNVPLARLAEKLEAARRKPSGERLNDLMEVLKATAGETEDPACLKIRARALRLTGRFEDAARTVQRAVETSADPELAFEFALSRSFCRDRLSVYWADGFLLIPTASDFDPLIEKMSAAAEPWRSLTRALVHAAQGRLDEADHDLEELPENLISPEAGIVRAHVRMLQRFVAPTPALQTEAVAEGESAIERVRSLDADDPLVIFLRGMLRVFREGAAPADEAARDLRRCAADKAAEPRTMSAILYHHAGNPAMRESELRRSLGMAPDVDVQVARLWAQLSLINGSGEPRTPELMDPIVAELDALLGEGGTRPSRALFLRAVARIFRMGDSETFSDPGALDDFVHYARHPDMAGRANDPFHGFVDWGAGLNDLNYADDTVTSTEIEFANSVTDILTGSFGWSAAANKILDWLLKATAVPIPDMDEARRAEIRREAYYRRAQISSAADPGRAVECLKLMIKEGGTVDDVLARVNADEAFATLRTAQDLSTVLRTP